MSVKVMSQKKVNEDLKKSGLVRSLLECTVCMEPCASPIHACVANGHLICGLCMDKLEEHAYVPSCPHCHSLEIEVNALAERQSRQNEMMGACVHNDIGCKGIFPCSELRKHVQNCDYRPVQCTNSLVRTDGIDDGEGCSNFLAPADMPRHLIEVHRKPFHIQQDEELTFHFALPSTYNPEDAVSVHRWEKKGVDFHPDLIKFDECYFVLQATIRNNMFSWWISIFGGKGDAEQFNYKTEILWKSEAAKKKNMSCAWEIPVTPYNRYQSYSIYNGNCAMIHGSTATAAADKIDKGVRLLSLKIKISKTSSEVPVASKAEAEGENEGEGAKRKAEEPPTKAVKDKKSKKT